MDDAFEVEQEQTYTLDDYLDALEEQELEADLVLGGDEGKDCTYNKGYMKRQAIFSCITCTPDGNAGVCTACSLSCHDGHEIIELWTKRNFRCDCGNSKFGVSFCKLLAIKDIENAENSYNHNFKGQYCTCSRPYPDPDVQEQKEMIQCCACEDWFHEEHLGLESPNEVPRDEEGEPLYVDLICRSCSTNFSFLYLYPETIWSGAKQTPAVSSTKGKEIENAPSASGSFGKLENGSCSSGVSNVDCPVTGSDFKTVPSEKVIASEQISKALMELKQCSQVAGPSTSCILGVDLFSAVPAVEQSKAISLLKNWREILCRCSKCAYFYSQKGIGFLLDAEDSIAEYEKIATQKRNEKLQQQEQEGGFDMSFLGELGHVEKMEFLHGIADIKDELAAFLTSCDPSKKTITVDDVRLVFDNLSKKRRRMD